MSLQCKYGCGQKLSHKSGKSRHERQRCELRPDSNKNIKNRRDDSVMQQGDSQLRQDMLDMSDQIKELRSLLLVNVAQQVTINNPIIQLKNIGLNQVREIAQQALNDHSSVPQTEGALNDHSSVPQTDGVEGLDGNIHISTSLDLDLREELSNLRAEVADLRKSKEVSNVTINQTIINNTVNIFDKRCMNLFNHLLKQCDNDLKRTASKIYSLFRGKKTRKTKYDYQDLVNILPPEVFSKILKRTGKDINGNYKYEYVGSDGVETCSTEHVDKILEDIMTDSGLQCYSQAIKESNDAYSRDEEMDNVRGEGGATNYLMEYSGIYGNQGEDLMSKIQDYRKLVCDPKHLDNTVARITNSD
jgi:hypothetical protein